MIYILLFAVFSFAKATVPASETFQYVNEGELGPYIIEYDGNYRVLPPFASPFQLCFYNTTPDAFTLALRMGLTKSESLFRWVWEANRGNPVKENATLTFGRNGNLVLADVDGRIAWQTNTSNKGVTGFKILPNGNMVLHDAKGNFIWQSFDYPTDTLLAGQSLRLGGPTKLVSRASDLNNSDGAYSLVMESKSLVLYYKGPNTPKPILYFNPEFWVNVRKGPLEYVKFDSTPENDEATAYGLNLGYHATSNYGGTLRIGRPNYNSTLSFLRLGMDGNIRIFTYYDPVFEGAWQETFTLFKRDPSWDDECQMPERCGKFGLCEDSQCVACPSPNGLLGWSKDCDVKKLTSCNEKDFYYYKLLGVDHFMTTYTRGNAIKEDECGKRCSKDCKCLGYFYNQEISRCWVAYDLKTLKRVANATHVAYIKAPK
ncbi:Epidermis-specific secreted glycoprotein EP1 [Hibiscus syriacus]|uniref:Epidermis-specific secreted glycoprotein EP1 n=1 Tax=Hibiscus syriacus TaxID=106335 RepID=A0A6A2YJC7_HIBSY|nr:epidermis-specific secreted glycoprotein EP1-like [Hibiscus syriacus]KAE8677307.1 Epidermis-specific secreted glycoprotein EP1 [Hibiscus syriacus]